MKKKVLFLLKAYKKYISKGYNCRFVPSCADYTYEAVEKYGVLKGLYLGFRRILRCHPWGGSGIDLVK